MKYTLSVLVEDESGVLSRISGLFARRGFNIESLAVGPAEQLGISRITMVLSGDPRTIEQLTKQLYKLINVLKGDMSVVGPRPHMESHNVNYSKHLKKTTHPFQQRHSIKPGITGLAQVRGFRGEIKGESDIINRVKYDIFYVKHWTFILDIKIIECPDVLRTLPLWEASGNPKASESPTHLA